MAHRPYLKHAVHRFQNHFLIFDYCFRVRTLSPLVAPRSAADRTSWYPHPKVNFTVNYTIYAHPIYVASHTFTPRGAADFIYAKPGDVSQQYLTMTQLRSNIAYCCFSSVNISWVQLKTSVFLCLLPHMTRHFQIEMTTWKSTKTHIWLKSPEIYFVYNTHSTFPIVLKLCTKHRNTLYRYYTYWYIWGLFYLDVKKVIA